MLFKDHFSGHAQEYSQARPTYPKELFVYLASIAPRHDVVWDCATGNGQAAVGLSAYFKKVIATDASEQQIQNAEQRDNIEYRVATAEHSGLDNHSVDLIAVAQALHWFDFDSFYREVKRVLKTDGVLAVWTYALLSTPDDKINCLINEFYTDIVGSYWPPERRHIDQHYKTIPFPFEQIATPEFSIQLHWNLDALIRYFNTWSSVQRYKKALGSDPVKEWLEPRLVQLVGSEDTLDIKMPLILMAGRL